MTALLELPRSLQFGRSIMLTADTDTHATGKPAILLAEDDPDQSDMLRERLEAEGFSVETAYSGDVALRRLSAKHYDAAIMDARMPGLHGGTVLKVCSVLKKPIATPVIMVSAFATPEDIAKYKKDGAFASFPKPLDVDKLLDCLRDLVKV